MTDLEFINYCIAHSETERALFATDHIERILRLAGDARAEEWGKQPGTYFVTVREETMKPICEQALKRLQG